LIKKVTNYNTGTILIVL